MSDKELIKLFPCACGDKKRLLDEKIAYYEAHLNRSSLYDYILFELSWRFPSMAVINHLWMDQWAGMQVETDKEIIYVQFDRLLDGLIAAWECLLERYPDSLKEDI